MQMQCKCNAIASQFGLKVTIVTTIKKGLPGNPHIAHIAHYKKKKLGTARTEKQKVG